MVSEAGEILSVLCGMFDMVNEGIMKRHRGTGIPSGGWKVVDQGFGGPDGGHYLVVMRRDDGKKFKIMVEDG